MEIKKTKFSTSQFRSDLNCNYYWLKISIILIAIIISTSVFSQPSMTAKEGFYYVLKVNHANITDDAINNMGLELRWVDIYWNMFDKANYDYYKKDEFKWPDYAKKTSTEIDQGIKSSDFNKIFSYTCKATFGKYNAELGCFPIDQIWSNITIASDDHINFKFTIGIGTRLNNSDFDFILKMDPERAEKLVESKVDNRTVDVKIIYNVVDKVMNNLNKWDQKYLGIYAHKIIFMDGSTILAEITPKIDYYDKVNFIRRSNTINGLNTLTLTDKDGNNYKTTTIENQVWMAENLKTTKFNDGTSIPNVTGYTFAKQTAPAYCWYKDNADNKNTYGALYNWYTVDTRKLCPTGWHVPTDYEWSTLITYLGGDGGAGGKLKEAGTSHWASPNSKATNEFGFTALPSGCRTYNGSFYGFGEYGYWWSSTKCSSTGAYNRWVRYNDGIISRSQDGNNNGFSVRCILHDFSQSNNQSENNTQVKTNDTNSSEENSNIRLYSNDLKIEFIGHFNNELSDGDYLNFQNKIFYKTKGFQIKSVSIEDYDRNVLTDFKIKVGQPIFLKLTIDGFLRKNGKAEYILAQHVEDESGLVYSSESANQENNKDTFWIAIAGGVREMPSNIKSKDVYMSFKVKDRNSDSIIQGFLKFTVVK